MFFKIISFKNFTIFLCWGLFLNKVATLQAFNFFQKETPTQVYLVDIAKFLRAASFIKQLRLLLLTVLPQYSKVS